MPSRLTTFAGVIAGLLALACGGVASTPPTDWTESFDVAKLERACDAAMARGAVEAVPIELAYLDPVMVWITPGRIEVRLGRYKPEPEWDWWGVVCTAEPEGRPPGTGVRQLAPRIWSYDGVM